LTHRTLIGATELMDLLARDTPVVLLDCSFDLVDPDAGTRAYAEGHLPGARYAHLDRDLSGPKSPAGPRSPAFTGRHPLPERAAFAACCGRLGITPGVQVVAYDGQGGPYAARAWWLLRWLGHAPVAVLDGGKAAWAAAGGPLVTETPPPPSTTAPYPAAPVPAMAVVEAAMLMAEPERWQVVDARAGARFRGEVEPLDPVAGHIPGAASRFFQDNLGVDGRFRPAAELHAAFAPLAADPARIVHQCGSGVTACHNLLAMAHAGLEGSALYPGSWSEWCADPARPVARG
jgi:thiosulfate/3-mercaptopyruvate sulfurtransferase